MNRKNSIGMQFLFTTGILIIFLGITLLVETVTKTYSLLPALFSLAVFLISRYTTGYFWGIFASMISMLAVNYAFTFPYFKFNFMITENLISAVIMLVITIMTSALTTKLKKQEQIRRESEKEKMRANLLRAVSHDLRTPLTTIYGSSAAIIEHFDDLTKEQILEFAHGMQEDSQWLIGMVENLLSVTRMQEGSVKLNKESVVLEELLDSVLVRFQKRYPKQNVELELPDDFISIPMDSVLITQVIVNMLENAVHHAEGMTRLLLRVSTQEDDAVFEIIDDGCGIPKDRLDHLFTGSYERKNIPSDNQKHNMGIGLTVCASVIMAHGGNISAENLPDGGCCFRFNLKMEENVNDNESI